MKTNIINLVLAHNFITNFATVTKDISNLSEKALIKGLNGFKNAYNDLPNLFDCGDVESILYFSNK